jgi:hypothetical protein
MSCLNQSQVYLYHNKIFPIFDTTAFPSFTTSKIVCSETIIPLSRGVFQSGDAAFLFNCKNRDEFMYFIVRVRRS